MDTMKNPRVKNNRTESEVLQQIKDNQYIYLNLQEIYD